MRIRHEQTLILGNKPIVLEHVADRPMKFDDRKKLKQFLKKTGQYNQYFS